MTPSEAFAAVALIAVSCDGSLDREEAHALRQQLQYRSPYRNLSELSMGTLFDDLLAQLRRDGWQGLMARAVPALNSEQQETALAMAAQLTHSDRVVQDNEMEMLTSLARCMALPAERSQQILDVVAVLNRDSLAS